MGDELIINPEVADQYNPKKPTDPGTSSVHGVKSKLVGGMAFSEADAAAGQLVSKFLVDTQHGVESSFFELSDAAETALRADLRSEMNVKSVAMPIIEIDQTPAEIPRSVMPATPTVGG